jgi:hypothetical protein
MTAITPRQADLRAISRSLFLPMLYWTGAVVAISLLGYPGVVCVTPLAWLLALPVGLRMAIESKSPPARAVVEAGLAGAGLGLWQGFLAAAVLVIAPLLDRAPELDHIVVEELHPLIFGLVAGLVSAPITAGLAAMITWMRLSKEPR